VLLPRLSGEEKPLGNRTTISWKKAGQFTCLFFWMLPAFSQPATWLTQETYVRAHGLTLSLQLDESRKLLSSSTSPEAIYINSLSDVFELLISENAERFTELEKVYETRINTLKKSSPQTAKELFVLAELRLQWGFVYLKFGHDFTAAWSVRQAHVVSQECLRKFPDFMPIKKTAGLLEIMLGSVPEKYQWVLNLLGMHGSLEKGLTMLTGIKSMDNPLADEAELLEPLINGFVLQQTDSALTHLELLHRNNPHNRLILFLGASLAIKNSSSELAMVMLEKLKGLSSGLPLHYSDYLLGEVYLHQGNYQKSITSYQRFINQYKGINYIKDAHYKIGLAYWLQHQPDRAKVYFELAKLKGREVTEADKYAARSLTENDFFNIPITQARYAIDGGYYDEAIRLLKSIKKEDLNTTHDLAEYHYRFARLYHKTNLLIEAKRYYEQTIELSGSETWYFAPNACLQMGYIYRDEGNKNEARNYFTKALSYKKHAYKNSIDSKAKSALAQLKK
jgi:tetratricopeptide (TPR) repeat protein